MDYGAEVETIEGEFGSKMDEMARDTIMREPNIIDAFSWSTTDEVGKVLWTAPCTISQFIKTGSNTLLMTHQMWMASLFQNWIGDLIFDFDVYGTHFHRGKLRFTYVPCDYIGPAVGSILQRNHRNLVTSHVVEFSGDHVNHSQRCQPATNLTMMYVPSPFFTGWTPDMNTLEFSQKYMTSSSGTFVVSVEVPLQATPTVAPTIYVVTSFSADNVSLSNPSPALPFYPMRHANTSTLGTEFNKYTRSERMQWHQIWCMESLPHIRQQLVLS